MPERFDPKEIAPCGVNCHVCGAFLKEKDACPGCRAENELHKRKSCMNCAKKNCAYEKGLTWCFECEAFPCARIRDVSRRYAQNYGIDLVRDGLDAREDTQALLAAHKERFACKVCGGVIDMHRLRCSECGGRA